MGGLTSDVASLADLLREIPVVAALVPGELY
jgi:hypothetical protein